MISCSDALGAMGVVQVYCSDHERDPVVWKELSLLCSTYFGLAQRAEVIPLGFFVTPGGIV